MRPYHNHLVALGTIAILARLLVGDGQSMLLQYAVLLRIILWTHRQNDARVALMILATAIIYYLWPRDANPYGRNIPVPQSSAPLLLPGPLRPLIIPCRTTHTRIFPKRHSFGYSYLQVGIPVGWKGSVSGVLGAEELSGSRSWFTINAADYLARDQSHLDLQGKLAAYLNSQGESITDYAHAYLLTAPRHLGYAFNPVSFWYLFTRDLKLQAAILEVNNTFDERRMYFMKRGRDYDGEQADQDFKFTHSWAKDFHVSPFNSRKGAYSLAAISPFQATGDTSNPRIDNLITLKSSKDHVKLVARIFSTGQAIDPSNLTYWSSARLLASWFWVGLVTYPRIVKEAAKLFFKHKLHVWYRPEVIKTSIGRRQTAREGIIASAFIALLQHQISTPRNTRKATSIEYTLPNGSHLDTLILTPESVASKSTSDDNPPGQTLKIQILTPQFFTDIASALSPSAYVLAAEEQALEKRTFAASSHQLFSELLHFTPPHDRHARTTCQESIRAQILSLLAQRHHDHNSNNNDRSAVRCETRRALDSFVLSTLDHRQRRTYLQAAMALVLADRFLGGFDVVLDALQSVLEGALAWRVLGIGLERLEPLLRQTQ